MTTTTTYPDTTLADELRPGLSRQVIAPDDPAYDPTNLFRGNHNVAPRS